MVIRLVRNMNFISCSLMWSMCCYSTTKMQRYVSYDAIHSFGRFNVFVVCAWIYSHLSWDFFEATQMSFWRNTERTVNNALSHRGSVIRQVFVFVFVPLTANRIGCSQFHWYECNTQTVSLNIVLTEIFICVRNTGHCNTVSIMHNNSTKNHIWITFQKRKPKLEERMKWVKTKKKERITLNSCHAPAQTIHDQPNE